ncbi:MAG: hypothetical protein ABI643_01830 [Candidatus Doudnabacteria bacterium]
MSEKLSDDPGEGMRKESAPNTDAPELGPNEQIKAKEAQIAELKAIVLRFILPESDDELEKNNDQIINFTKKFQHEHPDYEKYVLYHVLIGSTPRASATFMDTDDLELENYIRSLITSGPDTPHL